MRGVACPKGHVGEIALIVDEKGTLVFKVLLEIEVNKANEASMDSVVSKEKRGYKVILQMF